MSDVVRLLVDGMEFTGWTGVSISMDVDQMADAFSLSAPFDPERADLRAAFKPFGYQKVELYLDDEILITGRIEKVSPEISADDRTINIQGRSLGGVLMDCSIEGKLERSGLALSTIARELCNPFGIEVRADNDTNPLETARAEYGQTPEDFLRSLASPRRLFLNSSYDGKLVISWGPTLAKKEPVAALVEGEPPLLSVSTDFDGQKRFSRYSVATQYAGEPNIGATETDGSLIEAILAAFQKKPTEPEQLQSVTTLISNTGIPIYRPKLVTASDMDANPSLVAAKARTEAFTSSVAISCKLAGWRRPDGKRWAERQMITLRAPSAMLYKERRYLVAGVTLRMDANNGRTTDMRLVFPEIYEGKTPEVLPWD